MALPPICHCERRSKISALGHIAIGTWTMIGCSGWRSHFPFNRSSDHFMGRNRSYRIFADRLDSARPRQHLINPGLRPRANTNPCVSPGYHLAENIPFGRDLFLSPAEYLAQRVETLVECALRGAGVLFHGLELDRHHAQRKRNERALFIRQLDGPNVAAADFTEWPIIEKPLRAVIRFPSDAVTCFDCFASDSAEPDIVQHDPTPAPDAR